MHLEDREGGGALNPMHKGELRYSSYRGWKVHFKNVYFFEFEKASQEKVFILQFNSTFFFLTNHLS